MENDYKKKRCSFELCKKKCTILDLQCKCEKTFCGLHRLPETHNCDFDFKSTGREILRKQMVFDKQTLII
jgi:predicted nucleic acid binding AN1-type Zn finger protein